VQPRVPSFAPRHEEGRARRRLRSTPVAAAVTLATGVALGLSLPLYGGAGSTELAVSALKIAHVGL
jgi:hypothetical protein